MISINTFFNSIPNFQFSKVIPQSLSLTQDPHLLLTCCPSSFGLWAVGAGGESGGESGAGGEMVAEVCWGPFSGYAFWPVCQFFNSLLTFCRPSMGNALLGQRSVTYLDREIKRGAWGNGEMGKLKWRNGKGTGGEENALMKCCLRAHYAFCSRF